MNQVLAWITDASRLGDAPLRRGLSRGYVLPAPLAPERPEDLAGARVFIFLRERNGFRLHACLRINSVERFIEGVSDGDLLLGPDSRDSFLCSWPGERTGFIVAHEILSQTSEGVIPVPEQFEEVVRKTIAKNIETRFVVPDKAVLARLGAPAKARVAAARRAMESVLGVCTLEDVWAFRGRPRLTPFASVAFHHFDRATMDPDTASALAERLNALDPAAAFATGSVIQGLMETGDSESIKPASHVGDVDVNLLPLDPGQIYARVFVAKAQKSGQESRMAEETSRAEARHQEILRDVALRLIFLGFTPLASRSIDLAIRVAEGKTVLFEVKSSSLANVFSQAAKGIFQLHSYSLALNDEGDGVVRLGLIQEALDGELDAWVTRVSECAGVVYFPYHAGTHWPARLPGLELFLKTLPSG